MTRETQRLGFRELAPLVADLGWNVLPIAPGKKHPAIKGWTTLNPADHLEEWRAKFPRHGVGIRLGEKVGDTYLVGIDLDISNVEVLETHRSQILSVIGSKFERIGAKPRTLFLVRVKSSEAPRKQSSAKYADYLDEGENRIELLGLGQQFVAYGTHPDTHAAYLWMNEANQPCVVGPDAVPVCSRKNLDSLLRLFEKEAESRLWIPVGSKSKSGAHEGGGFADYAPPDPNVTVDDIIRALEQIDASDYNRWMTVGFALWHQFEGSDDGMDLWDEWSQTADNYAGPNEIEHKWKTMKPYGNGGCATIRSIFFYAKESRKKKGGELPEVRMSSTELLTEWLDTNNQGKAIKSFHNLVVIFSLDKEIPDLWLNLLTKTVMCGTEPIQDKDALQLKLYAYKTYGVEFPTDRVWEAITLVSSKKARHPVVEYLENCRWDGVKRIDTWLENYVGAESTSWVREVSSKFLIAAVARAYKPGTKWDYMLILEGPQRTGKSSTVHALSPNGSWTADLEFSRQDKVMAEILRGHWIIEAGELRGLNTVDIRAFKSFVSRTKDTYRAPYARAPEENPRQCIIIGTTNDNAYLIDDTGNRRFIPVKVAGANLEALERDRDLLWAEAAVRYREGEALTWSRETVEALAIEQDERVEHDSWELRVMDYLEEQEKKGAKFVKATDVAFDCFSIVEAQFDRKTQIRIASVMRRLGWKSQAVWDKTKVIRAYVRDI